MSKYNNRLQISVSDQLHSKLKDRAEYVGSSLPEYVRYVLMKEIERDEVEENLKYMQLAKESLQDLGDGNLDEFNNAKEALEYLDSYVKGNE
jgi:hypothetical protein